MNNKPKHILLVGNGSNSNRGCEAIVYGTLEILTHYFGKVLCTNVFYSVNKHDDFRSSLEDDIFHLPVFIGYNGIADRILKSSLLRYAPVIWERLTFNSALKYLHESDLVLSVGGDNYSLDYGIPRRYIQLGKMVKRFKKPFVIFGGSVGPFDNAGQYGNSILEHLREDVDQIHVREDHSYNYLMEKGCENVIRTADPAFLMPASKPKEIGLSETLLSSAIGINLSPLVLKQINTAGLDPADWAGRITLQLHNETKRPIILIYHVTSPHTNDFSLLTKVKQAVNSEKDIYLLGEGLDAQEIKWIISKLCCFIGSRTHATIASLSSCVPTVSIAYSVKAWGINQDLFGHTDHVLPTGQLTGDELIQKTIDAIKDRKAISDNLRERIDKVRAQALEAGKHLRSIVQG